MASRAYGQVLHQIERLFRGRSVAGLSEWQLLDRYASGGDEAAFEALVARYGPMVLGVCRRMLGDPHAAEDAFQATFLVLVRRAGALGPRDAVGAWLHGVAVRVALRARSESARRRSREVPVEWAAGVALAGEPGGGELLPILDEELGRLPAKYRAPVVLCCLEGLTHEEAARQLRWPVGSVKGRLARARALLKSRLARRGLMPTAGVLAAALARGARAAVPEPLRQATVRAALGWVPGHAAPAVVSASIVHLMEGGLPVMVLTKLKTAVAIAAACGGLALGAWALAQPSSKGGKADSPADAPPAPASRAAEPGASATPSGDRERALLEMLEKPLELELRQAPLQQALKAIKAGTTTGSSSGVPIWVEPEGLEEVGATIDSPITIDARKVPLLTALDHALRPLKLAATTRDGLLVVTSRQEAALIEIRKLNDELRKGARDPKTLETAEAGELSPSEWLKRMKGRRTVYAADYDDEADPDDEAKTRAILEALRKPIPIPFMNETPLEDALRYVREQTQGPGLPAGIPIYVDPVGLQEAEKTMTSPVLLELKGVALRESLRLVLKQLGLVYTVSDGLLSITNAGSENTPSPILRLAERAERGELSLREMNDLIELFQAREQILRYADGLPNAPPRAPAPTPDTPAEDTKTRLILDALERVVTLHFEKTPIDVAIAEIRKATAAGSGLPGGIPTYLSPTAAIFHYPAEKGQEAHSSLTVSMDLKDVKIKTALRLLLAQVGLGYTVREGLLIVDKAGSPELGPGGQPTERVRPGGSRGGFQ